VRSLTAAALVQEARRVELIGPRYPEVKCLGDSGIAVWLVLIVVLAVLWTDNTILAALAAILTLYAGLLASRIFPENYPNQRHSPGGVEI